MTKKSILVFLNTTPPFVSVPPLSSSCVVLLKSTAPVYYTCGLCQGRFTCTSITSTSLPSSISTISSSSSPILEVSALSSSLLVHKSHNLLLMLYGDATGVIPTQQLYIEAFLCDDFRIDHFAILETAPLILKAELFLYYTAKGGLAERFPPRLIDWEARLQDILTSIWDLPEILTQGFA